MRPSFFARRLHSLTGVVPLGGFLVEHLWTNASALGGEESFTHAETTIAALPGLLGLEIAFVWAPLAYHALYGVVLALSGRPNALSYPYDRNWLYLFQRVSGFFALAFLGFHLWEFRIQAAFFGLRPEGMHTVLASHLSSLTAGVPLWGLGYLLGLFAVVFHFANGLATASLTWGLVTSRRGQRTVAWSALGLGGLLFSLGAASVIALATGATL